MPEHIRALIVVLVVSTVVWLVMRPAIIKIIPAPTFARWRTLWYVTTLAWFLSPGFWIYVLVMLVVLLLAGRREPHVFGLYLLLLLAAPPSSAAIPGFGIVDHFFFLDHYRLLGLALLLPCAWRLATRSSTERYFKSPVDWMVFAYLLLNTLLEFRGDSFTNNVRAALLLWLDFFLPYYVASRSLQNTEGFRHALTGLAVGAVVVSALAVVEVLRSWKLFESASAALGLNNFGAYKLRGGFIRPSVTVIDSIVLGYVVVVASSAYLYLHKLIESRLLRRLGWVILATGIVASLSRGPWVGALVMLLAFIVVSPKPLKRLIQGAVFGVCTLLVLSTFPQGQKLVNLLPFVGVEEQGNVEYRADLLTVAIPVIERNLLFGASDFLAAPELRVMKQGEGIIDIVNSYLGVTLQAGLVGLFFFIGMFLSALWVLRRGVKLANSQPDPSVQTLGRALFASVIAIMFIIFTVSGMYVIPTIYYAVVGMASAYFLAQRAAGKVAPAGLAA